MKKGRMKIVTVKKDEKFLRQKSEPISLDQIKSEDVQKLIKSMTDHIAQKSEEAGLSAIQVGRPLALFIYKDYNDETYISQKGKKAKPPIKVMINPELSPISNILESSEEGCLSVPNVFGVVKRYSKIRVRFYDENGNRMNKNFSGFVGTIVQHEFDHLNGVLFTDKLVVTPLGVGNSELS